jgi:hypothetical protein
VLLRLVLWPGYDLGRQPGKIVTLNVVRAKADHINRSLSCVDADPRSSCNDVSGALCGTTSRRGESSGLWHALTLQMPQGWSNNLTTPRIISCRNRPNGVVKYKIRQGGLLSRLPMLAAVIVRACDQLVDLCDLQTSFQGRMVSCRAWGWSTIICWDAISIEDRNRQASNAGAARAIARGRYGQAWAVDSSDGARAGSSAIWR